VVSSSASVPSPAAPQMFGIAPSSAPALLLTVPVSSQGVTIALPAASPATVVPSTVTAAGGVQLSTANASPVYNVLVPVKTPQATAGDELLQYIEERRLFFYAGQCRKRT
jgi:hypothetical protein